MTSRDDAASQAACRDLIDTAAAFSHSLGRPATVAAIVAVGWKPDVHERRTRRLAMLAHRPRLVLTNRRE